MTEWIPNATATRAHAVRGDGDQALCGRQVCRQVHLIGHLPKCKFCEKESTMSDAPAGFDTERRYYEAQLAILRRDWRMALAELEQLRAERDAYHETHLSLANVLDDALGDEADGAGLAECATRLVEQRDRATRAADTLADMLQTAQVERDQAQAARGAQRWAIDQITWITPPAEELRAGGDGD